MCHSLWKCIELLLYFRKGINIFGTPFWYLTPMFHNPMRIKILSSFFPYGKSCSLCHYIKFFSINRVWTVFCAFLQWWLFVTSMGYTMTAGCISQKTEVTAQVSSLTVAVLLCAPHNLSGHTACQLTPWGDRMWVREPSDTAELLTYCRWLLAHVTVWMMLGGPHVYSFYTTATTAVVKLCLYASTL